MISAFIRTMMLGAALLLTALAPQLFPPEVDGEWALHLGSASSAPAYIAINQDGEFLDGIYTFANSQSPLEGMLIQNELSFSFPTSSGMIRCIGEVEGPTMAGTCDFGGLSTSAFRGIRAN